MSLAAGTAALGIAAIRLAGGPAEVARLTTIVMVTLVVAALANSRWRWSNHLAACGAGATLLAYETGPAGLASALAIVLVGWARLALGGHSAWEIVAGACVGAAAGVIALAVI